MSKSYNHILAAVTSEIWAVEPSKLLGMIGFLRLKAEGREPALDVVERIKASSLEAAARAQNVSASSTGAVAVLPLFGLIMPRGNMINNMSGPQGTSVEQFTQSFRQALNDPAVSAIVICIDSPGGAVAGVPELAAEILQARKASGKKIVAVSEWLCASAAYYIAASCSEIVVSPSSYTGSIGVYQVHEDISKQLEQEGVSTTLIHSHPNKVMGHNLGPLDDDARAELQGRVDSTSAAFEKHVAQGRKMKVADVQSKLGQGKVFNAQKAVSSGMADRVGTLDGVLGEFGVSRTPVSGSARMASMPAHPQATAVDCDCGFDECEHALAARDAAQAEIAVQHARYERELLLVDL